MTSPDSPVEARRHELFADAAEQLAQRAIEKHGLPAEQAVDLGNDLVDWLAQHWKGQSIYINGDQPFKLQQRDWQIFERMQRGNAHDLARELGISYVRVHQIYKRCLAEYRSRVQGGLFDTPAPVAPEVVIHRPENGL